LITGTVLLLLILKRKLSSGAKRMAEAHPNLEGDLLHGGGKSANADAAEPCVPGTERRDHDGNGISGNPGQWVW